MEEKIDFAKKELNTFQELFSHLEKGFTFKGKITINFVLLISFYL